ncbi:hypothetical protein SDC9_150669 [bioreactor metagenome]|uniref:Uncharacterized protein n=1 Tax=bioreactor metagenome TaxID=1076179 RepID=A0A645EQL9_9ZZZZ
MGGDDGAALIELFVHGRKNGLRFSEAVAVNVIEGEMRIAQRFAAHAVADDAAGENRTAGSHEGDFGHDRDSFRVGKFNSDE